MKKLMMLAVAAPANLRATWHSHKTLEDMKLILKGVRVSEACEMY